MTTQDWLDTFVSWLPMILIIGVWIFFLRRYLPRQKEAMELARRNNAVLERILAILESKDKNG